MKKKVSFLLVLSMVLLFSTISSAVEERRLISYYPSPLGAYSILYVGRGTQPRSLPPRSPENNITLMRINVIDADISSLSGNYLPATVEIGGVADTSITSGDSPLINFYVENSAPNEISLLVYSNSPDQPAIKVYKPSGINAPAIVANGVTAVEGTGTVNGIRGVGDASNAIGVYGEANNATGEYTRCGVVGTNNASSALPSTITSNNLNVAIYGNGGGENVPSKEYYGAGVVASGTRVGAICMTEGGSVNELPVNGRVALFATALPVEDYAGYFDGDIVTTGNATFNQALTVGGRARLSIPNIPVFNSDSDREAFFDPTTRPPQQGDLIYNREATGLQMYIGTKWETISFPPS